MKEPSVRAAAAAQAGLRGDCFRGGHAHGATGDGGAEGRPAALFEPQLGLQFES